MSASWPGSRTVVSAGAKAFFFDAETTSPRTTYQDAGMTTPHAHPVVADSTGRFPRVYLQNGLYRERVTSAAGAILWDDDNIDATPTVIPDSVDAVMPEQLIQTGTIIIRTVGGTLAGFARCNGKTIGNSASGATERANDDTAALFAYLWNGHANAICPVSGGRGATAAADFAANKTIALFDSRLAGLIGIADMGNTALTIPATLPFTTGSGAGGSVGGTNAHTLTAGEMPAHDHAAFINDPGHNHTHTRFLAHGTAGSGYSNATVYNNTTDTTSTSTTGVRVRNASGVLDKTSEAGGGGAHNNVQKSLFVNFYIKL